MCSTALRQGGVLVMVVYFVLAANAVLLVVNTLLHYLTLLVCLGVCCV